MAYWSARVIAPLLASPLLVAAATASMPAAAQEATALDRLAPAPAGDGLSTVPSAGVSGELRPAVGLLFSYSHQPLSLRGTAPAGSVTWVGRQAILHALASVELLRRIKLDLDAPFVLEQGGASGALGGIRVTAPAGGATLADLQAGGRVTLLPQEGLRPAAALGLSVWLPTGDEAAFAGAGAVRYAPRVIVGAEHPGFRWSASAGGRFQKASSDSLTGSEVLFAAGAGVRKGPLQLGSELSVWAAAGEGSALEVPGRAGAELLLTARWSLGPLTLDAGAGPGFGRLPGIPKARFFAALGVAADVVPSAPPAAAPAAFAGASAATKGARGAARAAPPAADFDGDSVPDAEDACPRVIGEARPPAAAAGARPAFRRGCPPDRDDDGIYDVDDRCPDVPGVSSAAADAGSGPASAAPANAGSQPASKHGCPADTDGDGIPNAADACPYERGKPSEDPATHGCPFAVRIEGSQIVILQQVQFRTGRAEIEPESFELLSEVAAVLEEHPEIARVAVDGHTDNQGSAQANLSLSQRRALAVVAWLTAHGIDARRLEARGFGARRPLADNRTRDGRAKNRRVEFQIRKRTDEGAAGWRDGPLE
ncbi:OmpA family protein [Sorangium atrum]|uniref:OmpA family protein n=2 Tax=Sorangium TaxID=39643 RepID=A0ABT5C9C0_9BACT|nr:OmpA family protein [Sorangium aterium]MDC0683040.1 OmpA family protein [Sorangium aterium]